MLKRIAAILLLLTMAFSTVSCKDEINTAPLQELMATTYKESEYTPSTYKQYTEALENAQEVLDSENKTRYDYNAAYRELKAAITILAKRPDKTALADKITEAEEYEKNLDSYYNASNEKLVAALDTAKKYLADEDATQGLVDYAITSLTEGIEKLEVRADKSGLVELVSSANEIDKDEYMNTDWSSFDTAVSNANKIIDKESATEIEINNAQTALTAAMGDLVRKPDNTALQALYDQAVAIDTTLYSKATVATLDYAKAVAWDALYIAQLDQAKADEVAAELRSAINGLQIKVTKTYKVTCAATMIYNNNVGDQWGYYTTINDHDFSKKYTFEEEVGITIQAEANVYENDDVTDWGSIFFDLVMTDGYTTSVEVVVRENRGTYAGNKAKWKMTYTITEATET